MSLAITVLHAAHATRMRSATSTAMITQVRYARTSRQSLGKPVQSTPASGSKSSMSLHQQPKPSQNSRWHTEDGKQSSRPSHTPAALPVRDPLRKRTALNKGTIQTDPAMPKKVQRPKGAGSSPTDLHRSRESPALNRRTQQQQQQQTQMKNSQQSQLNDASHNDIPEEFRSVRPSSVDHSFPKTPKPPVRFNLEKLGLLSGYDKILLFRDFTKYNMAADALVVYTRLRVNNIIHQLTYQDHHAMFHLLLSDAVDNRRAINDVVGYMLQRKMMPSESLWAAYIQCCARKWNDVQPAVWAFEQMIESKMHVETATWNDMLGMYLQQDRDLKRYADGLQIWSRMDDPATRAQPDLTTYLHVIALYGRLARVFDAEEIYRRASLALTELVLSSKQIAACERRKRPALAIKVERDMTVKLLNAMLAVYSTSDRVEKALTLANGMLEAGVMNDVDKTSQSTARDLYALLLKLCESSKDLCSARTYFKDAKRRGVHVDAVMFGRLIYINGLAGDLDGAREMFDAALSQLALDPNGMRSHNIHTAYLRALAASGNVDAANNWFFDDYSKALPKGKRILRMVYNMMIDLNTAAGNIDLANKITRDLDVAYHVKI
ncbi:hypothetical protein BASA50_007172 [Batrachochytrium salamandrivorans]|uniref:Pentacotripeptide-repeat region of PRORP domain-containing protein n=1 Tax=Batrachochytrium salamandrivorans TaxID=1357716 RepID=A0ABQ8F7U2_9FUNG|nr:hypothetical protein BASA60_009362 [Batrachochytrium salamandrivorans]KAH6569135.1 hypothetical protein BASA62_005061 [Batrachochytrium salamandrivorans]KAH6589480.1 hypothetical protein BASA61_005611 [Batrachochytrium salamandrivorans]KAH6593736.1 hypothetical protein BASA50_007172 [Batrachochytrium salamandrivorans]KAJ1330011.1 hypothetical protein BSLG_009799 [Batrachochytrium salamandrivorans]